MDSRTSTEEEMREARARREEGGCGDGEDMVGGVVVESE
jgi:hypothetical protein